MFQDIYAKYLIYHEVKYVETNRVKNTSNPDWNHTYLYKHPNADEQVSLSVCLSISSSVCVYVCLYGAWMFVICIEHHNPFWNHTHLYAVCLYESLCVCLSLSVCLYVCLSVCLSVAIYA